jgi:glucose uptake protein GlcU
MKSQEKIHQLLSEIMVIFIVISVLYVILSFPFKLYKYTTLDFLIFLAIALLLIALILKTCPSK